MNQKIIHRLRHGLIPAVPVPFDGSKIDRESQERYARWMAEQPVAGVAVWAHTGRGLYLSQKQREQVLIAWRNALPEKVIIAGAGGLREAKSDDEYLDSAMEMAEQAKSLGADAILCYAPARFRERAPQERDRFILEYHSTLAQCGLPMILFYLYEAAGGISYSAQILSQLLQLSNVIGIKIATLDSIMTYQDVGTLCRTIAPEKLVITGEDRFLGYSLMCGADAALVGMGASFTTLQSDLLQCYYAKQFEHFIELNQKIDALAQATFISPMEGYIARTSYILAKQGLIGENSWSDPWGPQITASELVTIDKVISSLAG